MLKNFFCLVGKSNAYSVRRGEDSEPIEVFRKKAQARDGERVEEGEGRDRKECSKLFLGMIGKNSLIEVCD